MTQTDTPPLAQPTPEMIQAATQAFMDQLTGDAIPEKAAPVDRNALDKAIAAVSKRRQLSDRQISRLRNAFTPKESL